MSKHKKGPLKTDDGIDRAPAIIAREQGVIILSAGDSARFAEALLDPPAPDEYLKRAAARHKKLVAGS